MMYAFAVEDMDILAEIVGRVVTEHTVEGAHHAGHLDIADHDLEVAGDLVSYSPHLIYSCPCLLSHYSMCISGGPKNATVLWPLITFVRAKSFHLKFSCI